MQIPGRVAQEGEAAGQELLVKDKELTRAREALAAARRPMPWPAVDQAWGQHLERS